jgi:hypothetical protein
MDYPVTVPAAMRPVWVCSALRMTGDRRATARRWWTQPEIPGAVSGLKDLNVASRVLSNGSSPLLGPVVVLKGERGPAGCLARSARLDHRLCYRG